MFASPQRGIDGLSFPDKVRGMASRVLARQRRSKVLQLRNTPPMVTFSFDDVPASACEIGAPILERYDARGTFFIAGRGFGAQSASGLLASREQIRALRERGHEIGCHTFTHPSVRKLSNGELGNELDRNKVALKEISSDLIAQNFAYPYGDFSMRTKHYLEGRFDSCRSGHAGINIGSADLGALAAWPMQQETIDWPTISELIDEAIEMNGWLIFYSHDVADQPSKYGISPDVLEQAVAKATQSGCVVTTIAESLALASRAASNG